MADQHNTSPAGTNPSATNTGNTTNTTNTTNTATTGTNTNPATPNKSTSGSAGNTQSMHAQAGSMVDDAKNTAHHLADQVQQKASSRLHTTLDQGKTRAADALGHAANMLRTSTQQMRDQNANDKGDGMQGALIGAEQSAGKYVESAANQMQQLSDYLRNSDVDEVVNRVERTARSQPALFLGGAFAIGLLGARFLKSSHRDLQEQNARNMNARQRYGTGYADTFNSADGSNMRDTGMYNTAPGSSTGQGDRDVTSQRGIAIEASRSGAGAGSTPSSSTSGTPKTSATGESSSTTGGAGRR